MYNKCKNMEVKRKKMGESKRQGELKQTQLYLLFM